MARRMDGSDDAWKDFIAGALYDLQQVPWATDPAFSVITDHPGLRESIGGPVTPALTMAMQLVRAMTGVDIMQLVRARSPALGLCLGFGMNALEPYELLQVMGLDQVQAYEWAGEQVIEAAQTLQSLRGGDPGLSARIRLRHGTLTDLGAIADDAIQVIYAANVFTWEVPMAPEAFETALQEILRVLAAGGVLFSRGSAGVLEQRLVPHGRMLLQIAPVTVFQKT